MTGQYTKRKTTEVDRALGKKIKQRRLEIDLSQDELARQLGITFQQIQKYEGGTNRVSVSRLLDICRVLKVKPGYFLDDAADLREDGGEESRFALDQSSMKLVRYFRKIDDSKLKQQLITFAKTLAE